MDTKDKIIVGVGIAANALFNPFWLPITIVENFKNMYKGGCRLAKEVDEGLVEAKSVEAFLLNGKYCYPTMNYDIND